MWSSNQRLPVGKTADPREMEQDSAVASRLRDNPCQPEGQTLQANDAPHRKFIQRVAQMGTDDAVSLLDPPGTTSVRLQIVIIYTWLTRFRQGFH